MIEHGDGLLMAVFFQTSVFGIMVSQMIGKALKIVLKC